MPNLYEKFACGAIFDFYDFPKSTLWITSSPKQATKNIPRFPSNRSLPRPCLFGPSVFLNVVFSMEITSFSVFVCFSLCYVLHAICIIFVHKTFVNAQPLSPPNFEKIAPPFKNNVFFYLGSLRLRFLLCIFLLKFGYPPWPDWSHLWPNVVPLLVDFGRSSQRTVV